jgi:uncharacterized phage-associated protein
MPENSIRNSAIAVANWLIDKNLSDRSGLTHLKVQKLLYYAQGLFLAYFDYPLFEDNIEAWRYGPVIQSIYHALHDYKDEEILNPIQGYVIIDGVYTLGIPKITFSHDDEVKFINAFWDKYSKLDPWLLVNSTHKKNTPWSQVINANIEGQSYNQIIPIELMKAYFTNLLEKSNNVNN